MLDARQLKRVTVGEQKVERKRAWRWVCQMEAEVQWDQKILSFHKDKDGMEINSWK